MFLALVAAAIGTPTVEAGDFECAAAYFALGKRYELSEGSSASVEAELRRRTSLFLVRGGYDPESEDVRMLLEDAWQTGVRAAATSSDPGERDRIALAVTQSLYARVRSCDERAGLPSLVG
ncbi:MAG: hypothetical protein KYX69_20530 [Sphingomonas sp.]|uniref:hypothetical protein n=1 Tax=Sphingomonas sp. TaxID=28214 RepID=UPI00261E8AD0|nr:hypothetical protein [Sphingomonas sp.]MDK2770092.1 hypothetical protein [Sphingomonas sp.]